MDLSPNPRILLQRTGRPTEARLFVAPPELQVGTDGRLGRGLSLVLRSLSGRLADFACHLIPPVD